MAISSMTSSEKTLRFIFDLENVSSRSQNHLFIGERKKFVGKLIMRRLKTTRDFLFCCCCCCCRSRRRCCCCCCRSRRRCCCCCCCCRSRRRCCCCCLFLKTPEVKFKHQSNKLFAFKIF